MNWTTLSPDNLPEENKLIAFQTEESTKSTFIGWFEPDTDNEIFNIFGTFKTLYFVDQNRPIQIGFLFWKTTGSPVKRYFELQHVFDYLQNEHLKIKVGEDGLCLCEVNDRCHVKGKVLPGTSPKCTKIQLEAAGFITFLPSI